MQGKDRRRAIGLPQDKAAVVFARFPSRFRACPTGVFDARAALSRRVNEITSDVDTLQPDSGGLPPETHTRAVKHWIKLSCSPQRHWPLTLLVGGGALVGLAHALDLRINTTASMPIGLYREAPARLERGAWVVFCLPAEPARLGRERGYVGRGGCTDGSQELVKEIAAIPGDRVALSDHGMVVNGQLILATEVHAADRSRRALSHAPYGERSVGAGEVWMLGIDRRVSWDSRYYGPVPLDHVRAGALSVLTFSATQTRGKDGGDPP